MKMRVSVSFVYISRALVRERFSRNTNKRVSSCSLGKEFQKEQKTLYLVSRNARKQQQQQDDAKL